MKLVIGISGKARNGKDTIADYFIKKHPKIKKVAFADLLKEQAKYLGWDGEKDLGGRTFIQTLSEPIKAYGNWLAQKYPNEYGDFSDNRYYSASLYRKIMKDYGNIFIISDMRFYNEWELLKSKTDIKFISIRVDRFENGKPFDNGLSDEQKKHNSETELDNIKMDYTIKNDGSLEDLYKKLDKLDRKLFYLGKEETNYLNELNRLLQCGFDEYGRIMEDEYEYNVVTVHGKGYSHIHYFENDVFSLCPYYTGNDESLKRIPNFVYKKNNNIKLTWVKRPLHLGMFNQYVPLEQFKQIIDECIKSLDEE